VNEPDIRQNAGRCDVCGELIDISSGDELVVSEYGVQDDEVKEEFALSDQAAADAVADALERVAESGAGYELASVIREEGAFRAHRACVEETNYGVLSGSV
jgi:hypothetical protein